MSHDDLCTGTFCRVRDEKDAEFYCQVYGDMAKKLCGTHWSMTVNKTDCGRYATFLCCKEMPEFNSFECFTEGVWNEFNSSAWGGKGKLKFVKTKDGFDTEICSEAYGTMNFKEQYCDEGLKYTICAKGKTHEETWKRHVQTCGTYKYVKDENLAAFMEKGGCPKELTCTLPEYTCRWSECGDKYTLCEWFGSYNTISHTFKLNEEIEYTFPIKGDCPKGRMVATKRGVGKFTTLVKAPSGDTEHWDVDFNACGILITGKNPKTGDSCKLWMKRFTDFSGDWRPVSISGVKSALLAMGTPDKMANDLANEYDLRLKIENKGNCTRFFWNSKTAPMDMVFKFGEEVTTFDPLLQENTKNVTTCAGNSWTTVSKSSKATFVSTTTAGECFLVCESRVVGCPNMAPITYVFERC